MNKSIENYVAEVRARVKEDAAEVRKLKSTMSPEEYYKLVVDHLNKIFDLQEI